jgi:hypothetical protein
MAFTQSSAEQAVSISFLVTGGMYAYRYFKEGPGEHGNGFVEGIERAGGKQPLLTPGAWIPNAGIAYLGLSILAAASPQIGGPAAILVGTGAFIGNARAVFGGVNETTQKAAANITRQNKEAEASANASSKTSNHPPTHHKASGPPPPPTSFETLTGSSEVGAHGF